MICTSTPPRASTGLSAGLALATQRSPPFGSASRRSAGSARPVGPRSLRPRPWGRGLAARRNSLIRVSRRAARAGLRAGGGGSPPARARDSSLASFERPPGAAFQHSLALLAALSDSGRVQPWGGRTPRFALHAQAALLRGPRAGPPGCHRVPPALPGRSPPRRARPQSLGPGSSPFARRYSGNRVCFLFLGLLICLSSARRRAARGAASRVLGRWHPPPRRRRRRAPPRVPPHSDVGASHETSARRRECRLVLRPSSSTEPSGPLLSVSLLAEYSLARTSVPQSQPRGMDPAAGSPTAALLRLLLPPDGRARGAFAGPDSSPVRPVGRSDGRCVQKTGTQSARGGRARLQDIPRSRGPCSPRSPPRPRLVGGRAAARGARLARPV